MSAAAMKWARGARIAHPGLTHLVTTLATLADANGASWRSQATLAALMGAGERTVRRYLFALAALGVVQRMHRSNGKGGRTSDIVRLRLDRAVDFSKDEVKVALQAAKLAGSNKVSNRPKTRLQAAKLARDKLSDQSKNRTTHRELDLEERFTRGASAAPKLKVVNGGRA